MDVWINRRKGINIDYIRRNLQMATEEKKINECRLKRFRHIIESLETALVPKKGKKKKKRKYCRGWPTKSWKSIPKWHGWLQSSKALF